MRMKKWIAVLLLGLVAWCGVAGERVRGTHAEAGAGTDALRTAAQATVRLIAGATRAGEFRGQATGTGIILTADGVVLTTPQALVGADGKPAPEIWAALVTASGEMAPLHRALRLKPLLVSAKQGLALLQLQPRTGGKIENFPFVHLAGQDELRYSVAVTLLGFQAGGISLARRRVAVVDFDDQGGRVLTESGLGAAAAGGPVLNERGELLGVQEAGRRASSITFFGDEDYPLGSVSLGEPGTFRALEHLTGWLTSAEVQEAGVRLDYLHAQSEQQVVGKVKDKRTGEVVVGAVIGIVRTDALAKTPYITASELVGYARSDFRGGFAVSRRVKSGQYLLKVVHPQYQTLVQEITIDPLQRDFTIELARN